METKDSSSASSAEHAVKDPRSDNHYILGISVNENQSIFSIGTLTGFKAFSIKTNRLLFSHGNFFLKHSLLLSHNVSNCLVVFYRVTPLVIHLLVCSFDFTFFFLEFGTPIGIVEVFPGMEVVGLVSSNGVRNSTHLNIWDNVQVKNRQTTKK